MSKFEIITVDATNKKIYREAFSGSFAEALCYVQIIKDMGFDDVRLVQVG